MVHLGWLSDSVMKKVSEKPRKLVKQSKNMGEKFYQSPEIERIIGIKTPLVYSKNTVQ